MSTRKHLHKVRDNIARARELFTRYDVDKVHPDDFVPRGVEQDEWEKLIHNVE